MSGIIFGRAFNVLKQKPFKLWGISLLAMLVSLIISCLFLGVPAIGAAVSVLIEVAMLMIALSAYHGEEIECAQVFQCFKDGKTLHVLGGMAWMYLWIFIWSLIPIAGIVFAAIRTYEYSLTPFILMTEPEISATDAIKVSKQRTEGYKGKMFGTDMILVAIEVAAMLINLIPVIGWLIALAVELVLPLMSLLVKAAYYEEIKNPTPVQQPAYENVSFTQDIVYCPTCGQANGAGSKFCSGCGAKL